MEDTRQLTWNENPKFGEDGRFLKWTWMTRCGRFRIDRWKNKLTREEFYAVQKERVILLPKLDRGGTKISETPTKDRIWTCFNDKSSKVDKYSSLNKAIKAIELFCGMSSSNIDEVLEVADQIMDPKPIPKIEEVVFEKELTSDEYDIKLPKHLNQVEDSKMSETSVAVAQTATTAVVAEAPKSKVMEVKESDARRLLVSMGHLTAEDTDKWDHERLERNFSLVKLAKLAEGPKGREPAEPECLALLSQIVDHLKTDGHTVSITKEAKQKVKRTPKESPNGTGGSRNNGVKDKWGYKEGTGSAAVNAVLMNSKVPLTMKQITEMAGIPKDRVNHVRELMEKKLVEKVGDTYVAFQKG